MKTTNYEISKKLAEAKFKANQVWNQEGQFWGYDLETILETLPNFIANKNKGENCLVIDVAFGEIHYEGDSDNDAMFITTTEENESLADTAARLWLKLKKEGLV